MIYESIIYKSMSLIFLLVVKFEFFLKLLKLILNRKI